MSASTGIGRQREKAGSVFVIDLGDGYFAFGIITIDKDYAFYNLRSDKIPPLAEIVAQDIIFRVPVSPDAIKSGKWRILGSIPLSGSLAEPAAYRNQPVGSNQLYRYQAGVLTPATIDEVKDLEIVAGWSDRRIEERLKDYFAGRPNPQTELFKVIKKYDPVTGQEIK